MRKDILSNYVAQIINIFLRFFLVPLYLLKLGVSAYGFIGFYFSIESIMVFLDFGMGVTSAKILAEQYNEKPKSTLRIIRSVEFIYVLISFIIGVIIFLLSGVISRNWLVVDDLSINVEKIIILMAILLTVSWPKSLYENFLIGRKMIIQKNVINISLNIIRTLVMIFTVVHLSGGIESYFYVMIATLFFETVILRITFFQKMGRTFNFASFLELKPLLKYTSGVGFFSILSLFVFQSDKIFISKFMPISALGIYNTSSVIPLAMFSLIYPITSAIFPRLVRMNSDGKAKHIFQEWSLILGILCVLYFAFVTLNLPFIYTIWLGSEADYANIPISIFLMAGTLIHSFTSISGSLLLANGHYRSVVIIYLVSVIIYLLYLFLTANYGIKFISIGWLICNISLFTGSLLSIYKHYAELFLGIIKNLMVLLIFLVSIFVTDFLLFKFIPFEDLNKLLVTSFLISFLALLFFYRKLKLLLFKNRSKHINLTSLK